MDNFKIIYRILQELEKNIGKEDFSIQIFSPEVLEIPYGQWEQLLILMQEEGYIKGLVIEKAFEDTFQHITEPIKPGITIKGLKYLEENKPVEEKGDLSG
ncbi:MAG: hypothetical protein HFI93_05725 [Lachnospiraceae bacterium]|nr:hypothetical protein [Lachnospiraceae bacterium]